MEKNEVESTVSGARDKIDNFCWIFPSIYFFRLADDESQYNLCTIALSSPSPPKDMWGTSLVRLCRVEKMTSWDRAGCSEEVLSVWKSLVKILRKRWNFSWKKFSLDKNAVCKIKKSYATEGRKVWGLKKMRKKTSWKSKNIIQNKKKEKIQLRKKI